MNYLVSVLVTFFNQEEYVDKTLDSIFCQKTEFPYEVIVGDDGSTDGTVSKIEKWMTVHPEIVLIKSDRNDGCNIGGFRASRNRLSLLNRVDTKYFIFLDGDDYFDFDGKLQKQVDILEDPANQDCIACGHNIDMLYADGRRVPMSFDHLPEGKYDLAEYWSKLYCHTNTVLTRSTVIPNIPQKLLENNFNDVIMTFTFLQNGKFYYIPESWAVYRQTGEGIWTGGKAIVNNVRNMFAFDLCNRINPSLKKVTSRKFSGTWLTLFRNRHKIDANSLELLSQEAKDRNMENSYNWIHYQELSWSAKQKLCIKALSICWRQALKATILKPLHFAVICGHKKT